MTTPRAPFKPIALPADIDPDGLHWLFNSLNGDEGRRLTDELIAGKKHYDALLLLTKRLDEREITLIILRYGINGEEPQTYREIGKQLNISKQHVARLLYKAEAKMRTPHG